MPDLHRLDSRIQASYYEINAGLTRGYGVWRVGRKVSGEGTSRGIGAGQFQAPVMRFGDPARNRQAKSRAAAVALGTRPSFIGTEKSFEDAWPQFRRNPYSSVRDVHGVFLAIALASHRDAPEIRRVLDRVI